MTVVAYVTALAWILGALGVIASIVIWNADDSPEDLGWLVWFGVLSWAWLIARYCNRWL